MSVTHHARPSDSKDCSEERQVPNQINCYLHTGMMLLIKVKASGCLLTLRVFKG